MKPLSWSHLLRRWCKCGLGVAFGLAVSRASAEDIQWHAVAPATAPSRPAVTMLAPVAVPAAAPAAAPDPFRKVSFTGGDDSESRVIFRAQMSDAPKMLPVGAPEGPEDPPRKKGDVLPPPHAIVSPPVTSLGGMPFDCGGGPSMACNADGCGHFGCDDCCGVPNFHYWASAEYLLWWIKGQTPPPLVTAGNPANDVPGALGQGGTFVLFGGKRQDDDPQSGARFRAGWWFDDQHTIGIDGSFFFLSQDTKNFTAGSFGTPALFRPFQNAGFTFIPGTGFVQGPPFEDAEAVAFPGALAGTVAVRQTTRLWGYDANLRTNLCNGCCQGLGWSLDGYAGFRSLTLDESLQVTENLASLLPSTPGSIAVFDKFKTENTFYGGQIGLQGELRWNRWFLDVDTKLGLGDVHQVVDIAGSTTTSDATGIHTSPGGLLAQGTNIGTYSRDRFAVLPELGLNFGYQVTDCLRLFVGYNILYVSTVVRPADQIDRTVNTTQIPRFGGSGLTGPANPAFLFRGTDFYAQGVNFGLEFRW
jgi:putative beta barrel porin BBP7